VTPIDPLTCREVFERLNDYLDRELSPDETAAVRSHLETCAVCASEYEFEGRILDELRAKLRRIDVPQPLLDKIRALLRTPPPAVPD
jgi:anti-sigma factor (TIGR02949 family)